MPGSNDRKRRAGPAERSAGVQPRMSLGVVMLMAAALPFSFACASVPDAGSMIDGPPPLCLDGTVVTALTGSVLDILERRSFRLKSVRLESPTTPGPLVLLDGREVDGTMRLASIPSTAALSIETLGPFAAVPEYGARAREGAIVVVTRAGYARGVTMEPDARPLPHCGRQ